MLIVDLFAGPGGWSLALDSLGYCDIGVEWDRDACATREQLGLATIQTDVRELPDHFVDEIDVLIASPPCQTFSAAGKQEGLGTERGQLVWEPVRFIGTHFPLFIAFEEVPEVLPIWRSYQMWLEDRGYSVWTGILNAADYGVPQSRKRAFLLASLYGVATPPQPTHAETVNAHSLFPDDRQPWVTMADALPHRTDLPDWCYRRPATTVVRSFCPHVIAAPGWRGPGDGPRQNAPGSVTVDLDELAVLQGAWPGFPFQGSKTKRFSLCGALLPPPWAKAILGHLLPVPEGVNA